MNFGLSLKIVPLTKIYKRLVTTKERYSLPMIKWKVTKDFSKYKRIVKNRSPKF